MLLFNADTFRLEMAIDSHFNTSNVTIQRLWHMYRANKQEFQYI